MFARDPAQIGIRDRVVHNVLFTYSWTGGKFAIQIELLRLYWTHRIEFDHLWYTTSPTLRTSVFQTAYHEQVVNADSGILDSEWCATEDFKC